jgi:hypothetical protein
VRDAREAVLGVCIGFFKHDARDAAAQRVEEIILNVIEHRLHIACRSAAQKLLHDRGLGAKRTQRNDVDIGKHGITARLQALSSVLSTQQPPLTTDSSVISRPVSVAINTRSPPESTRKSPFRSGMENTTLSPARYERTMVFRRSICCWELVSASQNGRHGVKS